MDPQHRFVLECGCAALLDGGHTIPTLRGSGTGIAIGIYNTEWNQILLQTPAARSPYAATAASLSIASGRVSYVLGMQGPCLTIDTACSASLVTTYCSVSALRQQECNDYAAIGVNLMLTPSTSYALAMPQMTSPTGRSRTFDRRADGFLRGEGCAAIALHACSRDAGMERLVQGIAVRQDGKSASLTAPNGRAQQSLIHSALADGALKATELCVFEAHGTGTALGDPIETEALQGVLKKGGGGGASGPQVVGSIKANLGHTETAAGLIGVSALLATLRAQSFPSNAQLRVPSPPVAQSMRRARLALPAQVSARPRARPPSRREQRGRELVRLLGHDRARNHPVAACRLHAECHVFEAAAHVPPPILSLGAQR